MQLARIRNMGYTKGAVFALQENQLEKLHKFSQKQGAGHLRSSRLSSLFKHFLGGTEKAQKRNFSIVSNINVIIIIITIIIIIVR